MKTTLFKDTTDIIPTMRAIKLEVVFKKIKEKIPCIFATIFFKLLSNYEV